MVAALSEAYSAVRPMRDLVQVKRVRFETSESGLIFLPKAFRAKGPRLKMSAQPDYWPAIVVAVGPDVRELSAGDRVYVYNFAEDTGHKLGLFTGHKLGKDEFLVRYPSDIVCAVEGATW